MGWYVEDDDEEDVVRLWIYATALAGEGYRANDRISPALYR